MSLTYPILSDICAIKINELLTLNKSMNSRLNLYKTKLNDDITLIMSKISTQDVKIDLIHNLFNQYKASVGNTLNHKENTINESDFIVFLDFAVPFIADFEKWGFKAIDPDLYYSQLNNFFCLIEKLTSKTSDLCAPSI